ncbi:ABC transporter ATP-binding protein [Ilumatobacter nonamiensis]|uniref:ABC transporter ATP-binding protein n=1 Tax=Ilumatobacter nonamiensis TaxID=467093 RepID=UPI000347F7D3|nr:ABC transporter ATP-binding protein [Ilumatobacter nonamiensis]
MTATDEPLLRLSGIERRYPVRSGALQRTVGEVRAVDGVDLEVFEGEAVGLVGESGSGKSTLGRVLLRLEEPDEGTIVFDGDDITHTPMRDLRRRRSQMQLIFQDPFSSLDPRTSVAESITEGLRAQGVGRKDRQKRLDEVLELVGLEKYHGRRFPHEFSGGQRQRVGIARALAVNPRLLVLDEPVSALDVSIQSQILNLLKDLQQELNLTLLFIAHDLSVVEHVCERIAVMYLGKIVEVASRDDLFDRPTHPYTEALLSAIPIPDPTRRRERILLQGDPPSPIAPPSGCLFHTRCPIAEEGRCEITEPELKPVADDSAHLAACLLRT